MRVFLIFMGWVGLVAAGLFGRDAWLTYLRPGATVFEQIAGYVGMGTSALVMAVCFGCVHIADRIDDIAAGRAGKGDAG
jgi:hypothetical protein